MNKVYLVIGHQTGEEDFIVCIYDNEESAFIAAQQMEYQEEYGYSYKVQAWEVRK